MNRQRWLLVALFGLSVLLWIVPWDAQYGGLAQAQIATITATFTPEGFSPIPTPTSTTVIKMANEILHPGSGDAVSGYTQILGYASVQSFRKYDVHIAVAGSESWR